MKSGIKIFSKNKIASKGSVLSREKFRLFKDIPNATFDPEKAKNIISKAEGFIDEPLTVISLSLFRDKFVTGSRSNYEGPHHNRLNMLYYMTLAEICEDKGRFTEKIADVAWAIMEEATWVIPAHQANSLMRPGSEVPEVIDENNIHGMDLYAAITSAALAFLEYYLKDKLDEISPIICQRIDHLVYLRGVRPYIVGDYWWMHSSCNWITSITANILFASAVTTSDMATRERVFSKAMQCLDVFTSNYPEDGCCAEGPFYWDGAAGSLFDCLELIEDLTDGKVNLYHEPIIKNMCEFITNMNIDDRYFVNFEDAHPRFLLYGDMIKRMGDKLGSEALSSYGAYVSTLMSDKYYYFFGMPYRAAKDAMTPKIKSAPKTLGNTSVWYQGHMIAVFREFEETSHGLFLATKGGNNGEPGNHNDVGALVIFSNGKPVIVDPGVGTYNNGYFGESRYLRWYTNASYHSCPTVNGYDQVSGADRASKDEICSTEDKRVSMDISGAYPDEAGIVSLVRTSELCGGAVKITDKVTLEREGDISFHFTSWREPRVIGPGQLELADGRIMTYDSTLKLVISEVRNTNEYEDMDILHCWDVPSLWRITLSVRAREYTSAVCIK